MITIVSETEHAGGWTFAIKADDQRTGPRAVTLRLSFADYNLWSPDGSARPEAVAIAVMRFIMGREPLAEIGDAFDAARLRRRFADADAVIPTLLPGG